MLKIRELLLFVRLLLSIITDITCLSYDAVKPQPWKFCSSDLLGQDGRGKLADPTNVTSAHFGSMKHVQPTKDMTILSAIIVKTFIQQKTDLFLNIVINFFIIHLN